MKKTVGLVVACSMAVAMNAYSEKCEYHQWRMDTCSDTVAGMAAQKCDYYQWPKAYCDPVAPVAAPVAPIEEKIVLDGSYFDTDKTTIKAAYYSDLNRAVAVLNSKPNKSIVVIGHTDSQGSDAYNQKLSDGRAKSVMNYLVSKGIDADRIQMVGRGESEPVADNETAEGRALNRRVELSLR